MRADRRGTRTRALLVLGLTLLIAGCSPAATPTPIATPAATPTPTTAPTATPTLAATATPTATPFTGRLCTGAEQVGAISIWHVVSAGTEIDFITGTYTSTSGGTLCYLRGTSEGQIVSGGSIIADSGAASAQVLDSDPYVEVTPGDKVYSSIVWSNWCGSAPAGPVSMSFVLPNGLGRVSLAGSGIPVPPCTSSGSPSTVTATSTWHH